MSFKIDWYEKPARETVRLIIEWAAENRRPPVTYNVLEKYAAEVCRFNGFIGHEKQVAREAFRILVEED